MKQIIEGVYFIHGQDAMIPDSHMYVLGKPSSKDLSLIDAGLMGKGEYKIGALRKIGIELTDIKRIIMTHTHLDHIGCLPEIQKELPQAELWIHEAEAELIEKGDDRVLYGMDMFKQLCEAQFGIKPGAFQFQVDKKLKGGETLEIGGMSWEVIHIPGHSPGSIGLYYRPEKILIPGDVVYADYAIGRYDFFMADGAQLKDSLLALADLEVNILLPGHNQIMEAVPPGYIRDTAGQWAPYLT